MIPTTLYMNGAESMCVTPDSDVIHHEWTDEERRFVRVNPGLTCTDLSILLHRSFYDVRSNLHRIITQQPDRR